MTSPAVQAFRERGLSPKKSFGQNFLVDTNVSARIADLAASNGMGTVVEIGAGLGALTEPLLARAAKVVAIERDRDLCPILREAFADAIAAGKLEIVEARCQARRSRRAARIGTFAPVSRRQSSVPAHRTAARDCDLARRSDRSRGVHGAGSRSPIVSSRHRRPPSTARSPFS